MDYVIYFDISSIIFLAVIIWQYYSRKQFPSLANKCFEIMLWISMCNLVLDIFGVLSIDAIGSIPIWIPYIINALYFVFQIALPSGLVMYLAAHLLSSERILKKTAWLLILPALILEIIFIATLPFGIVFSMTEAEGYVRGPFYSITYLGCVIYLVIGVILSIRYRKQIRPQVVKAFVAVIFVVAVVMIVQFFRPDLLLTGTGVSIGLAIMYFVIQNPADMVDGKTGLFNYDAFRIIISDMIGMHRNIYIAVVRISGLRNINTLYGTKAGDDVIHAISSYISSSNKGWVCRIKNSRFVMVTSDESDFDSFLGKISQRQEYAWPIKSKGETSLIELQLCCFEHGEKIGGTDAILGCMNLAMAKLAADQVAGPSYYPTYEEIMAMAADMDIAGALKDDLVSGENILVYYQPIYNCSSNLFTSAEALVRYRFKGEILSPGRFIPAAEKSGLITKLDMNVVLQVFKDVASGKLREKGIEKIHVNLSSASFLSKKAIAYITEIMNETGVDPKEIVFEANETMASLSEGGFDYVVKELGKYGFRFALDDFGMAYSNIARLMNLRFDCVKIDRSLLTHSLETYPIFAAVINKFTDCVVAEGVETKEQAEFVSQAGVTDIQGFYYARPVPLDEINTDVKSQGL